MPYHALAIGVDTARRRCRTGRMMTENAGARPVDDDVVATPVEGDQQQRGENEQHDDAATTQR